MFVEKGPAAKWHLSYNWWIVNFEELSGLTAKKEIN